MPQPSVCSPSLQVQNTITDELFLHEAHLHTLANLKKQMVIVAQPSADKVTLTRYQPGWNAQDTLTRQEMLELHADEMHAPLLIHLNKTGTHFSAILPYVAPAQASRPTKRKHQSVGSSIAHQIVLE